MLLLILIPTAWLSVIALLVALCRAAAGDRTDWPEQDLLVSIGPKLVLSGGRREAASPSRRPHARRALHASVRRVRRTRAAHVSR